MCVTRCARQGGRVVARRGFAPQGAAPPHDADRPTTTPQAHACGVDEVDRIGLEPVAGNPEKQADSAVDPSAVVTPVVTFEALQEFVWVESRTNGTVNGV